MTARELRLTVPYDWWQKLVSSAQYNTPFLEWKQTGFVNFGLGDGGFSKHDFQVLKDLKLFRDYPDRKHPKFYHHYVLKNWKAICEEAGVPAYNRRKPGARLSGNRKTTFGLAREIRRG